MADNKRIDEPTGTQTVGHEWDGIEELNTPLPRWWLLTFYASILYALGYVVVYPAWPMIHSATIGTFGWTSRGDLDAELAAEAKKRAPVTAAVAAMPVGELALAGNETLNKAAIAGGLAAFKVHCVQCHGSGAAGSKGYPNLNDDDWLWGGDAAAIEKTLLDGIRQPNHDATRFSQMPAFAGVLKPQEIGDVVAHVRTISGQAPASAAAARGSQVFATNCAVCHAADGKGMRTVGAPNLTDGIWLYGGDTASITQTINKSRYGVMPAWGAKLGPVTVKMLAAYVHSLGGGEAAPAAVEVASNVKR